MSLAVRSMGLVTSIILLGVGTLTSFIPALFLGLLLTGIFIISN